MTNQNDDNLVNKEENKTQENNESHTESVENSHNDSQENTNETQESSTEEKLAQMTELAKRSMADMQNMKRRMEEERIKTIFRANADLIKKLLPVLDNLKRALEHKPKGNDEWINGIEMSIKQIEEVLVSSGLEKIESLDQQFNPDFHEAISQMPGDKDKVLQVIEDGYKIQDFVIRHAKAIVGNGEKA